MAINDGLARSAVAVVPSDTTEVGYSSIFVGGAGIVAIEPVGKPGTTVNFTVPAGGYVLCQCTKVKAASTATLMIGLS
ncbi:MAG: hypothetical protein EHM33_00405 [Chloroflexi bacterium]|nr:MAG: hypothetical protein EHM33_00405 [Chloroflexota bacterium]